MANEAETRRWNAPVWVEAWPKRERLTGTVSPFLLETVGARPAQRVCEIGCGGGALTISLARAVGPEGVAVGLDLSAPLLELARRRAEGVPNARFVHMDVQTTALDEPPFDLAVSQFGVMFFDEPLVGFGAVRRLLTPGGRFVFACWQGVEHNPWHIGSTLRPLLPPPPLPSPGKSPVGPFALGDDEYVREILEGAGFASVTSAAHRTSVRAPADAVVDRSLLDFMGVPDERKGEALALIDGHLSRFSRGDDVYEYPLAFRVYEASA